MLDIQTRSSTWRYNKMDIKPSAQVKKNLFNDDDSDEHESHQEVLDRELKQIQEQDKIRWGFDFSKNKPVPGGPYQWEINANIITDNNYLRITDNLEKTSPITSPVSPTKRSQSQTSRIVISSPSTQSSINDFFPKRKRSSPSTTSELSLSKRSKSESPLRNAEKRPIVARSLESLFQPIAKPDCQ